MPCKGEQYLVRKTCILQSELLPCSVDSCSARLSCVSEGTSAGRRRVLGERWQPSIRSRGGKARREAMAGAPLLRPEVLLPGPYYGSCMPQERRGACCARKGEGGRRGRRKRPGKSRRRSTERYKKDSLVNGLDRLTDSLTQ